MNKKLLFGLAIAGVTVFAIYKHEENKKNYTRVSTPKHPIPETEEEDGESTEEVNNEEPALNTSDKIKAMIKRYAIKFVNYIIEHKEQIEAIGTFISLTASIMSLVHHSKKVVSDLPKKNTLAVKDVDMDVMPEEIDKVFDWMSEIGNGKLTNDKLGKTVIWSTEVVSA